MFLKRFLALFLFLYYNNTIFDIFTLKQAKKECCRFKKLEAKKDLIIEKILKIRKQDVSKEINQIFKLDLKKEKLKLN